MNKNELIKGVAEKTGLTERMVKEVVDATIDQITTALTSGDDRQVIIHRFGTFSIKPTAARTGRNPQRPGETINIPAGQKVKFKTAPALKRLVQ